jgi:hypothetical protein
MKPSPKKLPRDEVVGIANAQKMLLWAILANLAINLGSVGLNVGVLSNPNHGIDQTIVAAMGVGILVAALGILVLQVASVIRLCLALKEGWATAIYVIFQFAPCINLILLLFLNGRATKRLQDCGIRVGLMGANARDVANYAPGGKTCSGCGETLDPEADTCPVCGQQQPLRPDFAG